MAFPHRHPFTKCINFKMVKSCCAYGCTKRYVKDSGVFFFTFPSDETLKNKWV